MLANILIPKNAEPRFTFLKQLDNRKQRSIVSFCIVIAGPNTSMSIVALGNPENNFSSIRQ